MKTKVFSGLTIVGTLLLGVSVMAGNLLETYSNQMDQMFGTQSTTREYVKKSSSETVDPWNFKSSVFIQICKSRD